MDSTKKLLKMDQDLLEELTCEEIIKRYEPFIAKKSISYAKYAEEKFFKHTIFITSEDIKQAAYMGAIKAYNEYDIEKGYIFFTYLQWCVNGHIKRYVRDLVQLRRSGKSVYDYKDVYLDAEISNGKGESDINISEAIADESDDISDFVEKDNIKNLLSILNEKERNYIYLYYYQNLTQVQIANKHNTSQVNVSRAMTKAFKKIRKHIEEFRKEEDKYMSYKIKPTVPEAIEYLKENASKDVSLFSVTNKYAKSLGLSITTVNNILNKSPEFENIKTLYKNSKAAQAEGVLQKKRTIDTAEKEVSATVENIDNQTGVTNTPYVISKEPFLLNDLTIDNSIKDNSVFDGVTIDKIVVTLPDGTIADYMDKEVKLNNRNKWLNREDLCNHGKSLDKALEIYDYLYK